MEIAISPTYAPGYYSMFLLGLIQQGHRIVITNRGFPDHDLPDFYVGAGQCAMVLRQPNRVRRVIIAADDFAMLRTGHIVWADVIAKVNLTLDAPTQVGDARVVPIGPTFGMRLPPRDALSLGIRRFALMPRVQRHFLSVRQELRHNIRRPSERYYVPGSVEPDFVFFVSTSWADHPDVAPQRALFMRACKAQPGLRFEGGFAPRADGVTSDYPELYLPRRYTPAEYIEGTRRSLCVFNNAAVHGCLGWKLGEFLALGKAIISTPLERKMPGQFEPGEHYIAVDGSAEQIAEAVARLRTDAMLRRRLEQRARAYYLHYLQPRQLVQHLLAAAYA